MRRAWLGIVLIGCGPIDLGNQRVSSGTDGRDGLDTSGRLDAGGSGDLDGAISSAVSAIVKVRALGTCADCFELMAEGAGGTPPYRFAWADGPESARREICPGGTTSSLTVTVRDADNRASEPHVTELERADASCALPPMPAQLCLQNLSFEGKAALNSGGDGEFDAAPWNACQVPSSGSNTPDVLNQKVALSFVNVSPATEGNTFLGLIETEQASQTLCEPLASGSEVSLKLDLGRATADGIPDAERGFLEIWGGISTDCSQRDLLWASPALDVDWTTYCVTLRPHQYMDQLTLRASSDRSLAAGTTVLVTVDHLVLVKGCP